MADNPFDHFDHAPAPAPVSGNPFDAFEPAHQSRSVRSQVPLGNSTGTAHDGDTFALSSGQNARLYGADAYELNQTGRTRSGDVVSLGQQARNALLPLAQPSAIVAPTGDITYGRPVASLTANGVDAGQTLIEGGLAVATPEYLKADPKRLMSYLETERLARLNRRGGWQTDAVRPSSFRHHTPDPWASAETGQPGGSAVFWDEPLPFQGLRPEIAKGYTAVFQDMRSTPDDLLAYAKANGFSIDADTTRKLYTRRAKTGGAGSKVTYIDPPRVLTDPGDGKFGTFMRGVGDPINVLDEAGAMVDALGGTKGRENVWSSDRRFGDVYANNLDQNRSILAHDDAEHPYARFGGQLVGGLALPGASIEGLGFKAAREVLTAGGTRFAAEQAARNAVIRRLGVAGAVEGSLAGAGQGEDLRSRTGGALIGGPAGLALGVATGAAAPAIGKLIGKPFSRFAGKEGERSAQDLTDGAIDAGRASAQNDLAGSPAPAPAAPTSPQRLLDQVTNTQRLVHLARGEYRDVLPLPSNAVDGIDEAARIEAGRFATVRAPDEDAALTTQRLQNANTGTLIAKRGPADLVTWLRSEGGIKAQGRELEHYGIDNTPRKGIDFAGGEARFGPLVRNDGMNYDDAALRAWEAGFFPDHAERPTVDEFLDTLNNTHNGSNRAYRTNDLAEVDAYEAARRQRGQVESAKDSGAPMMDDRAQPVGMADLDANAPPIRAYEEWGENAPNLAGNIRLDKLDSPQAIKRALVQTDRVTGGFDAARRGRITQAETKSLASDLGMTADDLLKRRKGEAFNAEQALAARQLLARSGTDLVNMAKKLSARENPGDDLEAAFREAWVRHAAIQEQVSGMTAEAGRLLSQFRMTADSRALADRVLPTLGDIGGGTDRLRDVAERIVDLERVGTGPGEINKFALRALNPKWKDKATELYINSLLSGPQTHVVNMLSNTITALAQIPEHAVSAGIGAARQAGGKVLSRFGVKTDAERVMFSEVGSRAVGLIQGTREGLRNGVRALVTGNPVDPVTKLETQSLEAIKGPLGKVVRTPTRLLTAEDELFKGIARRMELTGLSMRQARMEGLTGKAARDRAGELLANPTDDMLKRSFDYARYLTFQNPLPHDSFAAGLSRGTQRRPWAKLLLPFIRTPANILKFSAERSPLAVLSKTVQADLRAGGVRRDNAAARMLVGSGIGATIYSAALDGSITGGGPLDDDARRLMEADGWQPYSFKVGDKYYSYARLDPFSTIIGTAADMADLDDHMTDHQRENTGLQIGAAILSNLSNKTWLSGLSSMIEAIHDPDRNLENFVSRMVASIAVPGFVAQVARTQDPMLREARGWQDRIRSRIPGLSEGLPARRDVFGQPIASEGGVGPDLVSPIWTSTDKRDPVARALLADNIGLSAPKRGKTFKDASPATFNAYQALAGMKTHAALLDLVHSPRWKTITSDDRDDAVAKAVKGARAAARTQMMMQSLPKKASNPFDGFAEAR